MSQIKIIPNKDYAEFVRIIAEAYPGMKMISAAQQEDTRRRLIRIHRENPRISLYGLYRNKALQGCMRLFDFVVTFGRTRLDVGGVGTIAVDLVHKKEKICKELILFYMDHYLKKGTAMTALYPFRPDFYKKMGFGYGTKHNRYRIKPGDLPYSDERKKVRFLRKTDLRKLRDCYNRYASATHGMMQRLNYEMERFKKAEIKTVCYMSGKTMRGFAVFTFQDGSNDSFVSNDLKIIELVYEDREALAGLLGFLHTQADQVRYIIYNTQDENFHHIPSDPRSHTDIMFPPVAHESNIQGVGLMYRVLDVRKIFGLLKGHNFGGQSCRLRMNIKDSFIPKNQGIYMLNFTDGRARLGKTTDNWDVEIDLDISDFSSLLMGAVDFESLYGYGQADISSSAHLKTINRIFKTDRKPVCMTEF